MAEDTAAPPDRGDAELENKPDYPREAKPWRKQIEQAEKAFEKYQTICDKLSKDYADGSALATDMAERRFQMLYANMEVVKPSIYSRPPQPVVVPRFKDRKPVPRKASEILERAVVASFDTEHVHETFLRVRDDLALFSRGVCWPRYATYTKRNETRECVKYDWLYRKDFLHEPARCWDEVGWVARGTWLTREQGLERFADAWRDISYIDSSDTAEEYKVEQKARVWEIWSKAQGVVVWIHPNAPEVLDIAPPHLDLDGFFPCPRPAYGSLEPGTLIPCPDPLFYKDQLDEIDELTARISALSESLKLVGFYAAGQEDLGDAIETALKLASKDNRRIAVPLAGMSQFGGEKLKDAIVWLPVVEVATTVRELVALRKQLIDDVYQISGISDIMRGDTAASETLGAQQLKSQYGSIRIKDRQSEMTRLCDGVLNIAGEIMAENFAPETILAMSQTELPMQEQVIAEHQQAMMGEIQAAISQAQQAASQGQPPPDPAQIEQAKQALVQKHQKAIAEVVTVEAVFGLFRAERTRPFVLQIATDSTIQPDENAEKAARSEFATAFAQMSGALGPLMQVAPKEAAPLSGAMLKFVLAPFRAGREMEQVIEDFVEQMTEKANQPPAPNPEAEALKIEAETKKADLEDRKAERAAKLAQAAKVQEADGMKAAQDAQRQMEEAERKRQDEAVKRQQAMEDRALKMRDEERRNAEAERKAQHDGMMRQIDLMMAQITMETERLKIISMADQADEAMREKQEKEAQHEAKEFERETKEFERQARGEAKSSKRDEAIASALASLSQGLDAVAAAQQAVAASLSKPKTIQFGADGRPVGIQ